MNEEPFGPVAVLSRFKFDEVIAKANRLPYGLAAYAFTQNSRRGTCWASSGVGMLGINSFTTPFPRRLSAA